MKRLSSSGPLIGVGMGLGLVFGAVSLVGMTGADQLVDGRYDQVIAVSSGVDTLVGAEIMTGQVSAQPYLMRLATTDVAKQTTLPDAATEHVWLTGPAVNGVAGRTEPLKPPYLIASTVGAKFTVTDGGSVQTLEVIDVREVTAAISTGTTGDNEHHARFMLVSCRILGDEKNSTAAMGLIRFIVEAHSNTVTPAIAPVYFRDCGETGSNACCMDALQSSRLDG